MEYHRADKPLWLVLVPKPRYQWTAVMRDKSIASSKKKLTKKINTMNKSKDKYNKKKSKGTEEIQSDT